MLSLFSAQGVAMERCCSACEELLFVYCSRVGLELVSSVGSRGREVRSLGSSPGAVVPALSTVSLQGEDTGNGVYY